MLWYKSIKKINSESGVGWRLVWSISLCPSARALLCQGTAMCGEMCGGCRHGNPWDEDWDGERRGGHNGKGLEMPLCPALVHSHQRNLPSQEAPGLVLTGIRME